MTSSSHADSEPEPSPGLLDRLRSWGENAVPPTGLAALLSALHSTKSRSHDRTRYAAAAASGSASASAVAGSASAATRLYRRAPMFVLVPALLGASYLNLADFKTDAAGLSAAASLTYMAMALKRRQTIRNKFSVRGLVRGSALGLCVLNIAAGGYVFATGATGEDE